VVRIGLRLVLGSPFFSLLTAAQLSIFRPGTPSPADAGRLSGPSALARRRTGEDRSGPQAPSRLDIQQNGGGELVVSFEGIVRTARTFAEGLGLCGGSFRLCGQLGETRPYAVPGRGVMGWPTT